MAEIKLSSWTFPMTSSIQKPVQDDLKGTTASPDTRSPQLSPGSTGEQSLHSSMQGLTLGGSERSRSSVNLLATHDHLDARPSASNPQIQDEHRLFGRQSASPSSPFTAIGSGRTTMSPPSSVHTSSPSAASGTNPALKGLHRHSTSHIVPWPGASTSGHSDNATRQIDILSQHRRSDSRISDDRYTSRFNRSANDTGPANGTGAERQTWVTNERPATSSSLRSIDQFLQPADLQDRAEPCQDLAGSREIGTVNAHEQLEISTLWMGDLEAWMDENYIRRCIAALGWDRDSTGAVLSQISVKIIKSASTSSAYCFVTFPTPEMARNVLTQMAGQPPMLMPGSERTFKLNWATGLPGVQPKWEGEFSVFVGDIGRETTEAEVVALFTPLFPSTKSAKIMLDPATGASKGYGFVRFGSEQDMHRSLLLGQTGPSGTGLSLRGRTLRISEASGPTSSVTRRAPIITSNSFLQPRATINPTNTRFGRSELSVEVPGPDRFVQPAIGVSMGQFENMAHVLASPRGSGMQIPSTQAALASNLASSASLYSASGGTAYANNALSPSNDPNNTTVFVGGLPALITEDTLRSFFQHFGEIAYVKVPQNKGCGFVQFVRRQDAELAIAKMHDFPIHGKSRIRLSWGRSQGDKQVEHVRKLANALNIPFEAAWSMVQGQDHTTIKQIAAAVSNSATQKRHGHEVLHADMLSLGISQTSPSLFSPAPMAAAGLYQSLPPSLGQMGMTNLAYPPSAYNFTNSLSPGMINPAYGIAATNPYTRVPTAAFVPLSAAAVPGQILPHHVTMSYSANNSEVGQYGSKQHRSPAVASSSGSSEVKEQAVTA